MSMTRRVWRKVLLVGVGLWVLLGLAAFLFPQQVLTVDSGNVQADAIVVLGGGLGERPARAAELFSGGAASRIILSGAGDADGDRRILESKGVPPAAIQLEPNSKSTKQNAQFSIALLRALRAKRVIIVTSWYHSRRALNSFRHYAPDIQFYSRPSYFAYPRSDWALKGIAGYVRAEYVKLPGYWVCYGICPL